MCCLPLAALALPAFAQQAEPRQVEPKQVESRQGMVVVRDADTGELRAPTPDEARALHPRTNASAAGAAAPAPKLVTGPGGRRSVQLGERHMVYSVVTRGADGKLDEQCVHGAHAAEHALKGAHKHGTTKPEEHHQ
ncbi:hypothetical protein JN27_16090 [Massilia sp. BSC265]|nr:hypothetical protein JN27_16090 [Massilia sp. BSC265]